MKVAGIIPARWESSRFPGKPLVDIQGKSMIQRVYEQVSKCDKLDLVVVATDDQRICDHVSGFGQAIMTGSHHRSGTERCFEALNVLNHKNHDFDVVINIQGDEPFIEPSQIEKVILAFESNPDSQIVTLCKEINDQEAIHDPNVVKVVFDNRMKALYFSRAPIPYPANKEAATKHYKHIGIYGYKVDVLAELVDLRPGKLEESERLEQLRWLENNYCINVDITDTESFGIDTPEDLSNILNNQ